jgi:transcriptional regulator with XRE-family HTH domain
MFDTDDMAKGIVSFGQEVRRLRTQAGLTQYELGEKLNVSRTTVSQIERGKNRRPGDDILTGLERVLGLSRFRSLGLIAGDMTPEDDDVTTQFYRIAAIQDRQERRGAWYQLPVSFRQALVAYAQDVLLDTALRAPEVDQQTDLPSAERDDEGESGAS